MSEPKEKPILFSAPMVRAILEGRKCQTRRVVKPQPNEDGLADDTQPCPPYTRQWIGSCGNEWKCPYPVGTRLWVRETHAWADIMIDGFEREDPVNVAYRADGRILCHEKDNLHDVSHESWNLNSLTWRPSIFMPRWASRITLEVTGVRVERLQDISEEDAKAEGTRLAETVRGHKCWHASHRASFSSLWISINGADSWDANPHVWCYVFKRIEPITTERAEDYNHA